MSRSSMGPLVAARRPVSHETIYRSLFVQSRGVLKKALLAHLRQRRTYRRPKGAAAHPSKPLSSFRCMPFGRSRTPQPVAAVGSTPMRQSTASSLTSQSLWGNSRATVFLRRVTSTSCTGMGRTEASTGPLAMRLSSTECARWGTGKTHLALALGLAACQKGYRVRFTTGRRAGERAARSSG